MVRENHKMVREMSGKSQGILWGLMAGHPAKAQPRIELPDLHSCHTAHMPLAIIVYRCGVIYSHVILFDAFWTYQGAFFVALFGV